MAGVVLIVSRIDDAHHRNIHNNALYKPFKSHLKQLYTCK